MRGKIWRGYVYNSFTSKLTAALESTLNLIFII